MKKLFLLPLAAMLAACTSIPSGRQFADKVDALIDSLTLEEKASLVAFNSPGVERLGIKPYNWWNEALHGVARNGSATVFPQPIGMASSFDTDLLEQVFTTVSDEGRIKHAEAVRAGESGWYQGLTFWTPNINIFRDPRWGRGMETYGEDPYLTGQMGMAVVRGLQGDPDAEVMKAHACAKHLAVHSGTEANRHQFDAEISERDLRETYLPAFKDLVTKADVQEVMTAYNRFRGVPCGANKYLVQDILRGEWGFKGMVVSDCWALSDFFEPGRHGYVSTGAEAAAAAMNNGVDLECGSTYVNLPEAVESGLLEEEVLDNSLRKVLLERYHLGEMEGIDPWNDLAPSLIEGPEHRALSLKMAHESMVLLQNNGILPLSAGCKVALVGPNADDAEMQWGNYNPIPESTVTLLQAMQARCPELIYLRGCGILDASLMPAPDPRMAAFSGELTESQMEKIAERYAISVQDVKDFILRQEQMRSCFTPAPDEQDILDKLEGIDVVVFAGGISPRVEGEEMPVEIPGFRKGDRTDIEFPAVQRRLIKTLHDAGKKVVLVNFSGAAMGLVPETETCDAILQAWYPGQDGGTAITDVLFGEVNPSGKLPVTFYKDVSQLPEVEDYNMEGHTYRYFRGEPLFPFGFGLSYTSFSYGEPKVKGHRVIVPVTNTGKLDGTEIVQLYVRRPDDEAGPVKTLRGFKRISIPAGETVSVEFRLSDDTFIWWSENAQNMVPVRGGYELLIGGSSDTHDLQTVSYRY